MQLVSLSTICTFVNQKKEKRGWGVSPKEKGDKVLLSTDCGVKNNNKHTSNTENWRMIMKLLELQKTLGYSTNV